MAGQQPDWPIVCARDGCSSSRLPNTAWCLAHAAEEAPDAFDAELKRIGKDGRVDARGVRISAELLRRILAAAPRKDDRPTFTTVQFDQAIFQDGGWFDRATFQEASFSGATFQDAVGFDGATFQAQALFGGATFQASAGFSQATFKDGVWFRRAVFQAEASFYRATFQTDGAAWKTAAEFSGASFQAQALFGEAAFQASAGFSEVTFQAQAWFGGATFQEGVGFDGATFQRAMHVGPLLARQLDLDRAIFNARVQLEVTAAAVWARQTQFPAGAHLRLRFASVVLDDANLASPVIIAGVSTPFSQLAAQEQAAQRWEPLPPGPRAQRWRPRLVSMCRADVAGLRLTDLDLRACRFVGAHNLDRLRIEGAPMFAGTAGWWRARRKTLAEEQHWRAHRTGRWRGAGWYPRVCQPPAPLDAEPLTAVEPVQLAALYRDLRKGREDVKDEPGAADFYYGECEMRRHDTGTPRSERLVLWGYWLLSGYALRAWRALAALAAVVLLAGIVLSYWGFPSAAPSFRPTAVRGGVLVYQQQPSGPPPGLRRLPDAIRLSARSATALLRGPDRALTPLGEWLDIGLRFAGPLLLGLAVLSVRGRVRR